MKAGVFVDRMKKMNVSSTKICFFVDDFYCNLKILLNLSRFGSGVRVRPCRMV